MKPTLEQVEELLKDFRIDNPPGYDANWDEVKTFTFSEMAMHYDPWGQPISLRRWVRLYEALFKVEGAAELYMIVGRDTVGDYEVRTDWVAHDLGMSMGRPHIPLIFETQIFAEKPNLPRHLDIMGRYATWEGAEEGHQKAVEELKGIDADKELVAWIMVECACGHPRGAHQDEGRTSCIGLGAGLCECKEFEEAE